MRLTHSFLCALLALVLLHAAPAWAGDSTAHNFPATILVQLPTETNRIQTLEKNGYHAKAEIARQDGAKERKAMINDFKDHFTYCSVYYYMDTNSAAIMNKQFAGKLMDADGSVVQNPAIGAGNDYYIVYYGFPLKQDKVMKPQNDSTGISEEFGRGLIICNHNLQQLSYFYKLGYNDAFIKLLSERKYYYYSQTFDLEYYPYAKLLNKRLLKDPYHIPIMHSSKVR